MISPGQTTWLVRCTVGVVENNQKGVAMTKSNGISCVVALALVAWCYHAYAGIESDKETWGPYSCPSCTLATPMADRGTQAFIATMEASNYPGVGMLLYRGTGDQHIISNDSYCATYTRTDSEDRFVGGNVVERREHTGDRSREGGQRNPSGGGMTVPGGRGTSTSTTVNPSVTIEPVTRTK